MFKDICLRSVYTSDNDDIVEDFYNPVLKNAISFDRTSAYFSAKAMARYAEGLEYFEKYDYKYRLIISKDISEYDYQQIKKGYSLRQELKEELCNSLQQQSLNLTELKQISNMAYLIAKGIVEIKMAFKQSGIFHDKCGILTDCEGNIICFRGSNNETQAAIDANYESFQVTCSWMDTNGFYLSGIQKSQKEFDDLWKNKKDSLVVVPMEDVVLKEVLKFNKGQLITEEKILAPNSVVLDYDTNLKLYVNTDSMDWLVSTGFYKLKLKRKVKKIKDNVIIFKDDLTYLKFMEIDDLLKDKILGFGYKYYSTNRLNDYIHSRNLYIKKRAKLGIELKTDLSNMMDKYDVFKQVVSESMVRTLREKQMKDAFYMFAMMHSGNFSVPGSGKTSSALAVYAYLEYKGLVDKIVMVGPKNAFGSWIDEFKACFGHKKQLRVFNIQDSSFRSTDQKKSTLKYDSRNCNLFLFNYESLGPYVEEIKNLVSHKSLLVFDEVHKVKAIDGKRANDALAISQDAFYAIAMTGTPIPNSYTDVYNLLHILFNDEYDEFFGFDVSELRNPSPRMIELVNEKIQPFYCRTSKKELGVPDSNEDEICKSFASEEEKRLFYIIKQKYRSNMLGFFIRVMQLETNPRLILENLDISEFSDLLEITDNVDDIDYVDFSQDVEDLVYKIHMSSKKKKCIDLAKRLVFEGKKVVIWCIFTDSIYSLTKILNDEGIRTKYIMGEVPLENRLQLIKDYKNGLFDVLITNPHTLAESVSLHSVCHDAIYFEYSFNLVHLLQSKDRIHRLGLPDGQYTQYYYLDQIYNIDGEKISLDERVYNRLKEKEQIMLDAIDNNEFEQVTTPEEDLEIIFKNLI